MVCTHNYKQNQKHYLQTEVRVCKVQDTEMIVQLIKMAWPDEPKWRNKHYWTSEFLKPNSKRFGFVIEQINHQSQKRIIVGVAMYKLCKSIKYQSYMGYKYSKAQWFNRDFRSFSPKKQSENKMSEISDSMKNMNMNETKNEIIFDPQLKKSFHLLKTQFIHVTDVAVDAQFRGKGLGTQLMQSMVYSFPSGTRFGLEVRSNNMGGVRCYQKCGFVITRIIDDFYDYGSTSDNCANKMTLVSNFSCSDVLLFFNKSKMKRIDKYYQTISKELKEFHEQIIVSEEKVHIEGRDLVQKMIELLIDKKDWKMKFEMFSNEQIFDNDLCLLSESDLKDLFPKIGPRSRIRKFINELKNK